LGERKVLHFFGSRGGMPTSQSLPLAVASLKSAITWTWQLELDDSGLYRWYMDGTTPTQLRGITPEQAESALRRFVENSLRCKLEIVYTPDKTLQ
jgi:hypothetical protein